MSHYSCSSNKNIGALFKRLFPDSPKAAQFSCDKTKSAYLIKYCLAPYFKNELVSKLADDNCLFTLSFDESFNKVLQKEQVDLLVRFWDKQKNEVVSWYLGSQFLGHTRANDLLECLVGELSALREKNLVQLSMDGPKTNWKLFDHFVQ